MSSAVAVDRLDFAVEKSLRYHQRRRAYYERWHRRTMVAVLLAGAAVIGGIAPRIAGIVVLFFSSLDLAIGFSMRARDHELLHRRFTDLAVAIRRKAAPAEDDLTEWNAQRLAIEADEPPIYWALEGDCHNEVIYARDRDRGYLVELGWYHRLAMNYLQFDKDHLKTRREKMKEETAEAASA